METTSTRLFIPVLSIAGSDPSGGAGIQQDIKTCEALECYGMAVITALTAQSPTKVTALLNTSKFLEAQLTTLLDEVRPAAVKIGMLPDADSVEIIRDAIIKYQLENIVVDPVLASTSGHLLTHESALEAMKVMLFPLVSVMTPNIPEAEVLIGRKIEGLEDMKYAANSIADSFGCRAVLVKGGHAEAMTDVMSIKSEHFYIYPTTKISTPNTHGTGCRLSTAIACCLAKGKSIDESVSMAKEWLTENLKKNACMRFEKLSSH